MSELRVVGAGLGRTGTHSLKVALERLLGAPCYHMAEVFQRPQDVPIWHAAANGQLPDWRKLFDGYAAMVDWPGAAFWSQIAETYPNAIILLSVRDADKWWKSASRTIFEGFRRARESAARGGDDGVRGGVGGSDRGSPGMNPAFPPMVKALFTKTFSPDFLDEAAAKAAFERHVADVRKRAPANRLVEWRVEDGWGPLCAALGVPVPDEPFPVTNTTEQFRTRAHLDG
jgi:hypothetical protein